jgi:hypothetical protein
LIAAGLEVRPLGNDVGVGFAASDRGATALRLDAASLTVEATATQRPKGTIRRVTPFTSSGGTLEVAVDLDAKKGALLRGRSTLALDPPIQIGTMDERPSPITGHDTRVLAWARPGERLGGALWPLDGDGDVDAVHAASQFVNHATTMAITFRQGPAVYVGMAGGNAPLTAQGDLHRLAGLGPVVGSPAVAIQDGIAVVAWADRPSSDEPWRLRWVRFRAGLAPGEAMTFTPPPGGKGEQAMAPSIVAVRGGRFLLVWTEGPQAQHDVRALTLAEDGRPVGGPLDISASSANAGQAQAAVTDSGRAVVAFFELTDAGFDIAATSVTCPL